MNARGIPPAKLNAPIVFDRCCFVKSVHGMIPTSSDGQIRQFALHYSSMVVRPAHGCLLCQNAHGALFYHPQHRGKPLDEVAIVHDGQHGALETRHGSLEALSRRDVEVVDRLV